MATPCRADGNDEVPDIRDARAVAPEPGVLRISQGAVNARMRRVFQPNVNGEYKVSSEIVQQWKSKKGRQSLQSIFQTVGFDVDTSFKLCWFSPF